MSIHNNVFICKNLLERCTYHEVVNTYNSVAWLHVSLKKHRPSLPPFYKNAFVRQKQFHLIPIINKF